MRPHDTDQASLATQLAVFRRMTPEQRFIIASEMSDDIRALAEAGIRRRHSDYSDEEVRQVLVELLIGPELARRSRRLTSPAR